MFCSRCGKKVLESMLFCPFCGAEIVIPDQEGMKPAPEAEQPEAAKAVSVEEQPAPEPAEAAEAPEKKPARTSLWDEGEDGLFEDEDFDDDDDDDDAPEAEADEEVEAPDPEPAPRAAARTADRRESGSRQRRSARTIAPSKPINPDDIFMDDVESESFDTYDAYDSGYEKPKYPRRPASKPAFDDDDDEDYGALDDEDDLRGGFLVRHMRALVGIILFLVMILLVVLYGLSDAGQTNLAKINATLPIKAEIYSRLGYESYQAEEYHQAGVYYERALSRDSESYNYASSAAMAYMAAGETDSAAAMLKRCVAINPLAVEPYLYLIKLYPDASSRPGDVTMLIQQGYQTTQDARLNIQ